MFRTLGALAIACTLSSAAFAAGDAQIIVSASSRPALHAKLIDAANQVCATALANDPFDDFGSQEECVENSLRAVRRSHVSYDARQASNDSASIRR
jgi:hypothetical protein